MPVYSYKAKKDNEVLTGTLNAQNESDAVGDLRRQGLVVISLNVQKGSLGKSTAVRGKNGKAIRARVKTQDMVVFTRQMATMISAGIPLVEALEILAEQASNLGFRATLDRKSVV